MYVGNFDSIRECRSLSFKLSLPVLGFFGKHSHTAGNCLSIIPSSLSHNLRDLCIKHSNSKFKIHALTFVFPHFLFQKKSTGQQLMEQVNYHLDLIEKDYFGLQYTDPYNVPHWLDTTKPVKKQVKSEYHHFN